MFETIHYETKNRVAWLTLNRPEKLNAFIVLMNREVKEAVKKAAGDEEIRCIVVTGSGRAFCSGQDLAEVDENMNHGDMIREHYAPMVKEIAKCEKPIIAAVNGVAAGAGFSLALACDFRLLSEKASFLNAFVHVGLIPDSGNLFNLTKLIGQAKTLELSILGEKVLPEEALSLGLATRVLPMDTWNEDVQAFAERLAQMPTKAIGLIKRYTNAAYGLNFDEYLTEEAEGQRIAGLTQDHKEGVRSFLEKRKPTFIGK
ncbi:2-(1,2-epoxy-1,2-dihydrophenyl)acetyl-CoA isomerase [Peribacillus cavernae]|uniref:2-(1,2-epoxy-1,2-dihydrophenyl)acetyl-CoA isomerase n=1 Tax=Peribacillus cavernae TaxID=1674310 RepID=A0A3S0VR25_9BACI|nr:enoyl-CoA hydratase-related protein [Peribacillus cavernae]MDQ0218725.1 2-(1,2-epoxy-1,2-dihydrophenyl)acetyl-CoA isomerase [Peribacillus cavernae]RUQ30940.1 2-(1,2-epoxy-1,2-dihydrophenyl)acetyl-CoA isomerase [Peribacillus cavernae]